MCWDVNGRHWMSLSGEYGSDQGITALGIQEKMRHPSMPLVMFFRSMKFLGKLFPVHNYHENETLREMRETENSGVLTEMRCNLQVDSKIWERDSERTDELEEKEK